MPEPLFGFGEREVQRIIRAVKLVEARLGAGSIALDESRAKRRPERSGNFLEFGHVTSASTSAVGTIAGSTDTDTEIKSGPIQPWTITASTSDATVFHTTDITYPSTAATPNRESYNLFARPIGEDELCLLLRHYRTGKWLALPQTPQTVVHFQTTATLSTTDDDVTANVVHCLWGPYADDDTITVKNTENLFDAASGAIGKAIGDRNGDLWIDWVEC